jgi:hypothetical protein
MPAPPSSSCAVPDDVPAGARNSARRPLPLPLPLPLPPPPPPVFVR